jgi:hypothetical protein
LIPDAAGVSGAHRSRCGRSPDFWGIDRQHEAVEVDHAAPAARQQAEEDVTVDVFPSGPSFRKKLNGPTSFIKLD